jgi:hypothetical protein
MSGDESSAAVASLSSGIPELGLEPLPRLFCAMI